MKKDLLDLIWRTCTLSLAIKSYNTSLRVVCLKEINLDERNFPRQENRNKCEDALTFLRESSDFRAPCLPLISRGFLF